jgi:WD40 repeat protein
MDTRHFTLGILVLGLAARMAVAEAQRPKPPYPVVLTAAEFSPDGKQFLTGYEDNTPEGLAGKKPCARLWDLKSGKEVQRFIRNELRTNYVAFDPGGKQIVTGCFFNTEWSSVKLWDVASGRMLRSFTPTIKKGLFRAALSTDGKRLVCWETNLKVNQLVVWNMATGEKIKTISMKNPDNAYQIKLSPNGKYALLRKEAALGLQLIDLSTGKVAQTFEASEEEKLGSCAAFSPNSKTLVFNRRVLISKRFMTYKPYLVIWDVVHGIEVWRFGCKFEYNEMQFAPDGKHVALNDGMLNVGKLHLWDVSRGKEVWSIATPRAWKPSFSADGKEIRVFCGKSKMDEAPVSLFQTADGKLIRSLIASPGQ